eukprot:SAG22_NODE_3869_length_1488_cov_2.057595_2_plen_89_part_00
MQQMQFEQNLKATRLSVRAVRAVEPQGKTAVEHTRNGCENEGPLPHRELYLAKQKAQTSARVPPQLQQPSSPQIVATQRKQLQEYARW